MTIEEKLNTNQEKTVVNRSAFSPSQGNSTCSAPGIVTQWQSRPSIAKSLDFSGTSINLDFYVKSPFCNVGNYILKISKHSAGNYGHHLFIISIVVIRGCSYRSHF